MTNEFDKGTFLLRPTEAARMLGMSRSRIYELLRDGELPAVRVAGTLRVPVAQLMTWIEERTTGGDSAPMA